VPHDLTPRLVRGVFLSWKNLSWPSEDQNVGVGLLPQWKCAQPDVFAQNLDPGRYSLRKNPL